ncbi:hypothetical protein CR513_13291, partial [Mucuna pruriens]
MFRKVEINISLLHAIKQIPKYAKLLKELCVHKRKKMKGGVELGGIVSVFTRNDEFSTKAQQILPKKCQDPEIFSVPCTIGDCTFAYAMLDLGASINVMPTSIYKSLNFGNLESTWMTIQLANRSVVQPLGILEDVLVQHPIKDHSLFGIDLINELVKEHLQLDAGSDNISIFVRDIDIFDCLGSITNEVDDDQSWEVHNLSDSDDDSTDLTNLSHEAELLDLLDLVCKYEDPKCSKNAEVQVAETEKQLSVQVVTIFTTKYESANKGRDQKKAKAESIKKTSFKSGLIIDSRVESNLGRKDQKQVEAKSVLDSQVRNLVPSKFNSNTKQNPKSDSNQTRAKSNLAELSRPQQ